MSNNIYTEYVFKNSDYEHAMTELQAILFNISVRNQALLRNIHSYDFSQNSEEIRKKARVLYKQDDACSKKLLDMTFDLTEYIKKLDSYTAVFEELKTKSMEELIASIQTQNSLQEMENEAIPYVPEQDVVQEEYNEQASDIHIYARISRGAIHTGVPARRHLQRNILRSFDLAVDQHSPVRFQLLHFLRMDLLINLLVLG